MAKHFTVNCCKECPNRKEDRTYGAGFAFDWFCTACNDRLIAGYIEYPSEEPKTIPMWCPLPEAK